MNEARVCAACVVFNGNIVVSGGMDNNEDELNTVESYDVFADKWTSMPNMINNFVCHNLVVVNNKLFVVGQGTESYEVFDNACKKFVVLKHQPSIYFNKSLSIGTKIVIFQEKKGSLVCYDNDKNERSEESCKLTKDLYDFSCVKIPSY